MSYMSIAPALAAAFKTTAYVVNGEPDTLVQTVSLPLFILALFVSQSIITWLN